MTINLFAGSLCYFLLAQKVTKKGPAIDYIPMADGSLIKLMYYCSFKFSSLKWSSRFYTSFHFFKKELMKLIVFAIT